MSASKNNMDLGDESESPWGDVPSNSNGNTEAAAPTESLPAPAAPRAPVRSPGRGRRKHVKAATVVEALDDTLGPLGPLGQEAPPSEPDEPPALPQKEQQYPSRPSTRPSTSAALPVPHEPHPEDSSGRPPSSRAGAIHEEGLRTATQPNPAIGHAARPSFSITVGDPHTVGDLTSSHTVYQVRTKTTSKAYRNPEFEVSRRYRDFLWLYNQLHSNNPGVVVPPPPEKQAVGRFDTNFVESRRAALERMLNRTAQHPSLQHDTDLKLFLESETFNVDVKQREKKDPDMPVESKGMFSSLNISVGSGTKFIEHDDWFLDRRVYLESLETQLKALLKATDTAISQRRTLAEASGDLSASLNTLADVELSTDLTGPLASLADIQVRVRDLYERQAQQDVLTFGIVIDEYIRLIGSIKKAFDMRQRSWQNWHTAEGDLQKRRSALDKLMRQGRSQQDKMSQLQADVGDAERRAHQARLQFEEIGRGMRAELERFEKEKVEDFRMGLETFLESSVEAQKELIELWETFLMQLDADDEEQQGGARRDGEHSGAAADGAGAVDTAAAAAAEGSADVSSSSQEPSRVPEEVDAAA